MTLTDRRKPAYNALLRAPSGFRLTVGIHAAEGAPVHPEAEAGETIQEIAEKNEFGLGQPRRSFIADWFDTRKDWVQTQAREAVIRAARAGSPIRIGLEQLALLVQADVQKRIRDGIPPPNAPLTIAKKGSSTPLIDSGVLRSAIVGKAEVDP